MDNGQAPTTQNSGPVDRDESLALIPRATGTVEVTTLARNNEFSDASETGLERVSSTSSRRSQTRRHSAKRCRHHHHSKHHHHHLTPEEAAELLQPVVQDPTPSKTLELLIELDREQERMVQELTARMMSIQSMDTEVSHAMDHYQESQARLEQEARQREMQGQGQPINDLHGPATRELLGHPNRGLYGQPMGEMHGQPIGDNHGDVTHNGEQHTISNETQNYRNAQMAGGPRMTFQWPEKYPRPRPLSLRVLTYVVKCSAHLLHQMAMLHLIEPTEYERSKNVPWVFKLPPPPKRPQCDVIEPTWDQQQSNAAQE